MYDTLSRERRGGQDTTGDSDFDKNIHPNGILLVVGQV